VGEQAGQQIIRRRAARDGPSGKFFDDCRQTLFAGHARKGVGFGWLLETLVADVSLPGGRFVPARPR
jgi:hypothetical protein